MGKFLDETGLSTLVTNIKTALGKKQDKLTSGTNIKTVNRHSLLGSGDVTVGDVTQDGNNSFSGTNKFYGSLGIGTSLVFVNGEAPILTINGQGGGTLELVDNVNADPVTIKNVESPVQGTDAANKSYVDTQISKKQDTLTSGTNIKTVNGKSLLGSGDIAISGGGDVTAAGDNTFTGNNVFTQFVHSNYGFTIQNENINCSYYLAINTDGKFWISDDSDMDVEVTGVDTPTQDNAAANKKYVDDKVAAAGGVANKLTVTNFDSNSGRPISIQDTDLNDVLYVENNVGISYDGPMLTIKKCDNGSGSASCDAYVTNICGKGIEIGSASNGDYDYGTVISKGEILLYGSPVVTKESIRTALPIGTSSISSTTTETIRLVSSTTSTHRIILANSSGTKTILLPANPYDGETFEIIRIEGVSFILTNNSGKAMQKCTGTTTVTSMNISSSGKYTCIYSSSVNRWYVMRDDFVSF